MHALLYFKGVHEIASLSCFFWVKPKERKNDNQNDTTKAGFVLLSFALMQKESNKEKIKAL